MEDLTDFLNADKDPPPPPFEKRKFEFKLQTFMIVASNKCILCSEAHHLFKCGKFLTLTVEERFKVVKDAYLCFNWLRNHKAKDCKFGVCKKCGKRQNTLLHISKAQNSNKSNES